MLCSTHIHRLLVLMMPVVMHCDITILRFLKLMLILLFLCYLALGTTLIVKLLPQKLFRQKYPRVQFMFLFTGGVFFAQLQCCIIRLVAYLIDANSLSVHSGM